MDDISILRGLAEQVRKIADGKEMKETRRRWTALNDLKPERPMVAIDQLPWNQFNAGGELTLHCKGGFNRWVEGNLRQTLFKYKYFKADMIVSPYFAVYKTVHGLDYGLQTDQKTVPLDAGNSVVGHSYIDQLKDFKDIEKIKTGDIREDKAKVAEAVYLAEKAFDGALQVVEEGIAKAFALWDTLVTLHGVENCLYDLVDRPEFIHAILEKMTECSLKIIDWLDANKAAPKYQDYIHCTGAMTNDLPAKKTGRIAETWTYGMSQIFATVSPAMHEEFEFPYLERIFKRYGMVYYGCCEPLHNKIDMIKKYSNVRKVSISPWADAKAAAEKLGSEYVLSLKPSPAFLASGKLSRGEMLDQIRGAIDACKANGTPLEIILKDVSTVNYNVKVLTEWEETVMALVR